MPKTNKAVAIAKGKGTKTGVKAAKSEVSFQQGIERMQLALALGKFDLSKVVERGKLELVRIRELANKLKDAKVLPLSDYTTLLNLYNNELAHLTLDYFTDEADNKIERFMNKTLVVTKGQQKVIEDFHFAQAKANFKIIENIQNILINKGMLKAAKEEVEENEPAQTEGIKQEL